MEAQDWKGRRVFVTGAGGFIGSHLAERLVREGASVRALVHYNALGRRGWLDEAPLATEMDIVRGDVRDRDCIRTAMQGIDVVFHLAALIGIPYSYRAPRSYLETNVDGTINVLQAAREIGLSRVVVTSTSEVYGSAQYTPIDENHPLQAQSPYSASKIAADKMAEAYYRSFGVPVVTLRPFNTYGPRQSARAVIPTIVTQALAGGEVRLGSLDPIRDFVFVHDTVAGFLAAGLKDAALGEVVHLGTGTGVSIGQIANTVLELVGRELPVVSEEERQRPEASEVQHLEADPSLAEELLGWRPEYELAQGLGETIRWIEHHRTRFRTGAYEV